VIKAPKPPNSASLKRPKPPKAIGQTLKQFQRRWRAWDRPRVFEGEDAAAYQQLLAMVIDLVKPADIMDWIWVRDIVDLQWDISRLRRAKANLIAEAAKRSFDNHHLFRTDLSEWANEPRDPFIAHGVAYTLDKTKRIDRMLLATQARRDSAYKEAERHTASNGSRSRRAAEQIEDAEFRVIEHNISAQERAA
jgi:hypothetical protein